MRPTTHADYSLRVPIYLGIEYETSRLLTMKDLAQAYAISQHHLRIVVHKLAKLGFVQTTQGKGGGSHLARSPERIGVGEVVRGTEPDFHIVECFGPTADGCRISLACTLQHMLAKAQRIFVTTLDRYTVADMIKQHHSVVRLQPIAA